MQLEKPRFDWSLNLGHVLTILAIVGAAVGYIQSNSKAQTQTEMRLLDQEKKAITYIPIIEGLRDSNIVQNNRIENISQAIQGDRAANSDNIKAIRLDVAEINKTLGNMREGFARLETTVKQSVRN